MVRAGTRAFSSLQLDARGVDRLCAAHRRNQSDAGHQLAAVASVHDGTGLGDLHTAFVARRLAAASASALLRSANTPQKEKRKGKKPPPRGGGRGSKGASRVSSAERAAPSAPHAAPAGTVPSPPTAHASLEESGLDPVLADLARTFLDDEREDALRRMLSEWDVEEHSASLRAFGVSSTQHLLDLQEADIAELGLTRDRARDLYAKIKAGQQRAAKEIAVPTRPLLMAPSERQYKVRSLALRLGAPPGPGGIGESEAGKAAAELMQMINTEESTNVGVEMAVQVVAEFFMLHTVISGITTGKDMWRVLSPPAGGAKIFDKIPQTAGDLQNFVGVVQRNAVVEVAEIVFRDKDRAQYLRLPPQPGLSEHMLTQEGFVRLLNRQGQQILRRVTDLSPKLPMMGLLMSLSNSRHACLELARMPRLVHALLDFVGDEAGDVEQEVKQAAMDLLQRLQKTGALLRAAGDGGRVQTLQRALQTCASPAAPELHALRTNKVKYPAQARDDAITIKEESASGARRIPEHMRPVPLTYGIGASSIRDPAPKSFLSLRHGAAPMVLNPPLHPYQSVIGASLPSDSSVCTFDRVRI